MSSCVPSRSHSHSSESGIVSEPCPDSGTVPCVSVVESGKRKASVGQDKRREMQKERESERRKRMKTALQHLGQLCGLKDGEKATIVLRAIEGLKQQARRIKIFEEALQIPDNFPTAELAAVVLLRISQFADMHASKAYNITNTDPKNNAPILNKE